MRRRPSKITLAVAGTTIVTAAVASGTVVLWPASTPAQSASSLAAASENAAHLRLAGGDALPSQALMSGTQAAQRQQQTLVVAARLAAARRAAARRRAEHRAALAAAQQAQQPTQPAAATPAPAAATPAPAPSAPPGPAGSPQQIAMGMLSSYGWSSGQFSCLDALWNQESGWNVTASNPSSGAYGIPQALPGSKMSSAGPDWQTNPATQIRWGLGYIKGQYGDPCGAWAHEQADGWY